MSRPQTVTDAQILSAVHAAVMREGAFFWMAGVAASLGVSQPVMFQRFGTRAQLIVSALQPHIVPTSLLMLLSTKTNSDQHGSFEAALLEVALALESFFMQATPCLMALKELSLLGDEASKAPMPKVLLRAVSRFLTMSARHFELKIEAPESGAVAFIGAFQTRAFLCHLGVRPHESATQYSRQVAAIFARGLRKAGTR